MKVLGINGSPRKKWNTATLLEKALEGASGLGADTELIHLYDLAYKGCTSCFSCKIIGGKSNGRCAMKDDLTPVLKKIENEIDVLILGTPIYFGAMTGETRSFVERLLFAPTVYSMPAQSLFPRKIKTGLIYTMNATEQMAVVRHYGPLFASIETYFKNILGSAETLCSYDTYQFPDYSKVVMEYFDPAKKAERRKEVFPEDCIKALELGRRLAGGI